MLQQPTTPSTSAHQLCRFHSTNAAENVPLAKRIDIGTLRMVVPGLIDERQSAFIKDRHILHGTLILNEAVEEAKKCKKPALVFKVDFEKAYDSVSWSFLDYMLDRMVLAWILFLTSSLHYLLQFIHGTLYLAFSVNVGCVLTPKLLDQFVIVRN